MSMDRGMDKKVMVHIYNGILLSHRKYIFESVIIYFIEPREYTKLRVNDGKSMDLE